MLSISFHNPDFPDDIPFDVGGIEVPNNGSVSLDYDQELLFYAKYREKVKDYFKDNQLVTVEGTTELKAADYKNYPGEVSEANIIDLEEGDPTIPETEVTPAGLAVVEEGDN